MTDVTFSMSAALDRRLFCRDGGSVRHIVVRMRADGPAAQIAEERKPLNIALVIDASASMRGEKLDAAKAASIGLIERLAPSDRLSLVSFAEDARSHLDAVPASAEQLARMRAEVNLLEARGNTDLALGYFSGVEHVALVAERDAAMTPRVILLSDGRANRGIVSHAELFRHADELRRRGVLTSALGIGDGYDEHLLSGMAEHGGGRLHDAERVDEISSVLHGEIDDIMSTVVENARLALTFPSDVRVEVLGAVSQEKGASVLHVNLGPLQQGIERLVVFRVTCPAEIGLFGQELCFDLSAIGEVVGTGGKSCAAGPVMQVLTAVDPLDDAVQPRDPETAGIVARVWSAEIVAHAAHLNRSRNPREAERFVERECARFATYADGLEGGEEMCMELERLRNRIGDRLSSRSSKEMYLHRSRTSSGRADHRGPKPGWSERLDDEGSL